MALSRFEAESRQGKNSFQESRRVKRRSGRSSGRAPIESLVTTNNSFLNLSGELIVKKELLEIDSETTPNVIFLADRRAPEKRSRTTKNILRSAVYIGVMTVGLEASAMGLRIGMSAWDNSSDWQEAGLPPSVFLDKNADILPHVEIGGSFSLERYGLTLENYKTPWGKEQYAKAMADLKELHENEKVNNLRIEFQWKDVVDVNGKFDPGLNEEMDNYLLNQEDMKLTVNIVGPKTFRWPEQNVPKQYKDQVKAISERDGILHPDDALAKESIRAQSEVLNNLQNKYSKEQLFRIKVIQLNNESKTKFGDNPIITDDAYDIQSVSNVIDNFPKFSNVKFLFNSAGFNDVNSLNNLCKKLKEKYPQIKLVMGIDYYPIDVGNVKLPLIGDANPEQLPPPLGHVDPRFYDTLLNNDFKKAKENSIKVGYDMEITELQAEPWDGNAKLPGNLTQDFQYALKRSIKVLNPDNEQIKLPKDNLQIDVWGLEYLMQNKNDPEVKQVLQEMRDINTKSENERTSGKEQTIANLEFPNSELLPLAA
jgi:hypothetical protein